MPNNKLEKIKIKSYSAYLRPRKRDSHKGLYGHVLIIGGNRGYAGAPRMAAEAALRVGAGLVSVATHPDNAGFVNITRPEIMAHAIRESNDLSTLFNKATFIVIGPGLGQDTWARDLLTHTCKQSQPLLIDADGLSLLATTPHHQKNWILTPHPGEAARLLQQTVAEIQHDRIHAVKNINQRYGGVTVLKGFQTLVMSENQKPAVCDKGNPGMATAGMGDVLSGVIAGLAAQNIPLSEAAKLGVFIHALAGDRAAKLGQRGMVATDLLLHLRYLVNPKR